MTNHRYLYGGASRPVWAGPVHSASSRRLIAGGSSVHSVDVAGLVVPVSVGAQTGASGHSFGLGLGFPDLGKEFSDMHPGLWDSWGRLENVLTQAATNTMAWDAPPGPRQAARTSAPLHALKLSITRRRLTDPRSAPRPDTLVGKISKMFAIRDVSGTKLRFESAGAAANFTLTPSSAHWSRDPRTL
jgi:hypothetical protein